MQEYIGEELEKVVDILKSKGINYKILDNNFNVNGDKKLVTNIFYSGEEVVIVSGDFIFNIRNKNSNEK